MTQDQPDPKESFGRVLRFRPRAPGTGRPHTTGPQRAAPGDPSPINDLARYERVEGGDDYRHRMRMNALSIVFVTLLVIAGIWIANTMAELQKKQDCALQGRRNCLTVEVPTPSRQ